MSFDELRMKEKLNGKGIAARIAVRRMNEKNYLQWMASKRYPSYNETSTKDQDIALGKKFFDEGFRLTDEELAKERYYFAIGYRVAERIAYGLKLLEEKKVRESKSEITLEEAFDKIYDIVTKKRR